MATVLTLLEEHRHQSSYTPSVSNRHSPGQKPRFSWPAPDRTSPSSLADGELSPMEESFFEQYIPQSFFKMSQLSDWKTCT